jgi:K+ transporter
MVNNQNNNGIKTGKHSTGKLALLALGVVFGDIGTSPLYPVAYVLGADADCLD